MKNWLGAHCDEFLITSRLFLKMDWSLEREAVLHFFERIRREYPGMRRFRRREDGALLLEESEPQTADGRLRRWIRLEPGAMRFGYAEPPTTAAWTAFSEFLLSQVPYHLTLTDLEIDYLELVYAFDLDYQGNHDQLVAETLLGDSPLGALFGREPGVRTIDCQPCLGITLTQECDLQAYVELKSRTSTFEVRTGEYECRPLSVCLTLRRYWGFGRSAGLVEAQAELAEIAAQTACDRVVPLLVNPLAVAIASRR